MTTAAGYLTSLVERLAIEQPWSWSSEGLDDACMFCPCEESRRIDGRTVYGHVASCVWLEAMNYLGRPHPDHQVLPPLPAVPPCDQCGDGATIDDHVAHLAREFGRRMEEQALAALRVNPARAILDPPFLILP